jgi:hypothetical protein
MPRPSGRGFKEWRREIAPTDLPEQPGKLVHIAASVLDDRAAMVRVQRTASTARSIERTSTPPAAKGGRSERDRSLARWSYDQGPPRRRCAGLPVAFEVTAGQQHDSRSALPLIAKVDPNCLMSIDTTRTIMSLPFLWSAASISPSRRHTSRNAADSVADPRAVR